MSKPEEVLVQTLDSGGNPDVTLNVKNLKWSCDGHGDQSASFTMLHPGTASNGDLLAGLTQIQITDPDYSTWAWHGRVRAPGGKPWPGGQRFTVALEGMQAATRDRIVLNELIYPSGRNIGEIMKLVGEGYVPDVFCSAVQSEATAQRVLRERTEDFVFASPYSIFETLAPLGDGTAPLIWEIYAGGSGTLPTLTTRARPVSPAYYAVMESTSNVYGDFIGGADLDVEGDVSIVRTRVNVKYRNENTGTGYKIYTEEGAGYLGGLIKDLGIDINRMQLTNIKAVLHAAGSMLAQLAAPQNTGRSIRLPYPCTVIAAATLTPVPLWAVKPNNVIQILDYESGTDGIGNEFYIDSTSWDEQARLQALTTGPVR